MRKGRRAHGSRPPRERTANPRERTANMTSATQAADHAETAAPYPWVNAYPKDIDWQQSFAPAPLYRLLDEAVAKHGKRPCTQFLGRTLSYAEIGRAVDRAAAGLQRLGITKDSKVGLLMPNCPTFIVYYFAVLK